MKIKFSTKTSGFSLIEMLVVIMIISMLVALGSVSYERSRLKARDNIRRSDLKSIQQAVELFAQSAGYYPYAYASGANTGKIGCDSSTPLNWGSPFTCTVNGNSITFMAKLPADPNTAQSYKYFGDKYNATKDKYFGYYIGADLEDAGGVDDNGAVACPDVTYVLCYKNP